ncbi:thioredoxin domain-containing protein (plasmid) [Catenovulum sp. SX2]|uniref:thioredoxin domain-containing protein n=1 Tax=Catenovulum sp. SX2 TaxID=3398614 RepID=UPI003F8656B4
MIRKLILSVILCVISVTAAAEDIDWNSDEINWHTYESGIKELQSSNSYGVIVLYADWCSVCKMYSKVFKDSAVVSASKGVTLIKANAETELKVKALKEYDQKYVPKTIVIDKNGQIVSGIFGEKRDYMFFLPADNPEILLELLGIVKSLNERV